MKPHLIYCHGFASGPLTTSKGAALRSQLVGQLSSMQIPDLEGESFLTLTIDGMVERLETAIADLPNDGAPLVLAGSSLGAWLAAYCAPRLPRLAGLLLIAPAFGFVSRWRDMLGVDGVAAWRSAGQRPFFHYRSGEERPLGVAFLDSCAERPDIPDPIALPTCIIHGRHDELAPWRQALNYATAAPDAEFHLLNDGHSLDGPQATTCILERASALLQRLSGTDPE